MFAARGIRTGLKAAIRRNSLREFASLKGSLPERIRNIAWLNSDNNGIFAKLVKERLKSGNPFCRSTSLRNGGFDLNLLIPEGSIDMISKFARIVFAAVHLINDLCSNKNHINHFF